MAARLQNTSQSCNAANRFIVTDDVYGSFLEKLSAALAAVKPGDPTAPDSTIGPLPSKIAADQLDDQARRAIAHCASVAAWR